MWYHLFNYCLSDSNPPFRILLCGAGAGILKNTCPRQLCHLFLATRGTKQWIATITLHQTFCKPQVTGPLPRDLFARGLGEPRSQHLTHPTGHSNTHTCQQVSEPLPQRAIRKQEEERKVILLPICLMFLTTLARGQSSSVRHFSF